MDYKINVYPSSEKDLLNIKTDHREKTIKAVQVGKLKELYKKKFGAAVQKFNDYALSGKIISDYYKAICDSNIPEVYRLTVVVRYDLANPNEVQLIQKSFTDFKKKLDEQPWMTINSVYWMSVDEFKELNIYFVPVSDGYVTSLSTRNDLIDVTKSLIGSKDNLNILKAMPLFVQQIDAIWKACADSQIVSQDELEKKARLGNNEDPNSLHSIEIGMLKENANHLQRLTHENQMLEAQIAEEKKRINKELNWTKEMIPAIQRAEQERLNAIEHAKMEAIRAEKERIAAEQRAKEDRRRAEEARQQEAARLKEQARKNYDLRSVLDQNVGFAGFPSDAMPQEPELARPMDFNVASPFNTLNGMAPVDAPAAPQQPQFTQPQINPFGMNMSAPAPVAPQAAPTHTATMPNEVFTHHLHQHMEWMSRFGINENMAVNVLPQESLSDIQRLVLKDHVIVGYKNSESFSLVGAQIFNCVFENCELSIGLYASVFVGCKFINCTIFDTKIERSGFKEVTCSNGTKLRNVDFNDCTAINSDVSNTGFVSVTSTMQSQYNNLNFTNAKFDACDIKRNTFNNSNFDGVQFTNCDARAAVFNNCNTATMSTASSLFTECVGL